MRNGKIRPLRLPIGNLDKCRHYTLKSGTTDDGAAWLKLSRCGTDQFLVPRCGMKVPDTASMPGPCVFLDWKVLRNPTVDANWRCLNKRYSFLCKGWINLATRYSQQWGFVGLWGLPQYREDWKARHIYRTLVPVP